MTKKEIPDEVTVCLDEAAKLTYEANLLHATIQEYVRDPNKKMFIDELVAGLSHDEEINLRTTVLNFIIDNESDKRKRVKAKEAFSLGLIESLMLEQVFEEEEE